MKLGKGQQVKAITDGREEPWGSERRRPAGVTECDLILKKRKKGLGMGRGGRDWLSLTTKKLREHRISSKLHQY